MKRFSSQNPTLLDAAVKLAEAVRSLPTEFDGQPPRAFLVGGFVRDSLLGIISNDVDMEVFGVSPDRLSDAVEQLFPHQVNAVGRSFGILKVALGDGIDLDIAIPRRESKAGTGHVGFSVTSDPTLSVEEASRRRDFTINAMMANPLTDELVDPWNGQADLSDKTLRAVDPIHFVEDPLRVYRAVQFAARFGFTIEPKTFDLLKEMVSRGDLDELSHERITDEIRKLLLKSPRPSVGFDLMHDLGIIARDYPELYALEETNQEPEWHPEGNVWIHTLLALDVAANIIRDPKRDLTPKEHLEVMMGALCHDLGKPATTKMGEKNGIPRLRSLGHEEAGVEPTKSLLRKWAFGDSIEHAAVSIAKDHLKPGMLLTQKEKGELTDASYANAVRKLIKRIHPMSWRVLLAASESDYRGRAFPDAATKPYSAGKLFEETVAENHLDEAPLKPFILGSDLIERGMKPGPDFGKYINAVEEARDRGKVRTREEALEYLDELLPPDKGD